MRSNVTKWLNRIDDAIDTRLEASGVILVNNIKDSIRDKGLIDTGRLINDIQYVKGDDEVRAGSSISKPNYPLFLELGFRHHLSGEIVGPYRFMTTGVSNSEGPLRALWSQPIRG